MGYWLIDYCVIPNADSVINKLYQDILSDYLSATLFN